MAAASASGSAFAFVLKQQEAELAATNFQIQALAASAIAPSIVNTVPLQARTNGFAI